MYSFSRLVKLVANDDVSWLSDCAGPHRKKPTTFKTIRESLTNNNNNNKS
jgi:hypothetical protein